GDARGGARIDREQSPEFLVGQVGRLDPAAFVGDVDAGSHDVNSDRLARVADCVQGAVDPRLDVRLARSRYEEVDIALRAEADQAGAEFEPRLIVVLA